MNPDVFSQSVLEVGAFGVNCSILSRAGRAWIVDPGAEAPRIIDALEKRRLAPAAVLLTHAHFDHIGAIPELERRYPGLPVVVAPEDVPAFTHPLNQYPPDYPPVAAPKRVCAPDDPLVAELGARVIPTPGHTPGGVCYFLPAGIAPEGAPLLLSGDTLFAGSVGRTDLPGGNMTQLRASLARLAKLPDETRVVPGHGPATTLAVERRDNPFWTA